MTLKRKVGRVPNGGRGLDSVAVVVDGTTEKIYFEQLGHNERRHVLPRVKDGDIDRQYDQVQRLLAEGYAIVYWLIDYDDIARDNRECQDINRKQLTKLKSAINKYTGEHRVKILFNSPCLEYWLLLHHDPANCRAYEQYEGELATALQKPMPGYAKTKKYYEAGVGIYRKLRPKLPTAVAAARSLHDFNPLSGHCAPVADVWQIISDLNIVSTITAR